MRRQPESTCSGWPRTGTGVSARNCRVNEELRSVNRYSSTPDSSAEHQAGQPADYVACSPAPRSAPFSRYRSYSSRRQPGNRRLSGALRALEPGNRRGSPTGWATPPLSSRPAPRRFQNRRARQARMSLRGRALDAGAHAALPRRRHHDGVVTTTDISQVKAEQARAPRRWQVERTHLRNILDALPGCCVHRQPRPMTSNTLTRRWSANWPAVRPQVPRLLARPKGTNATTVTTRPSSAARRYAGNGPAQPGAHLRPLRHDRSVTPTAASAGWRSSRHADARASRTFAEAAAPSYVGYRQWRFDDNALVLG